MKKIIGIYLILMMASTHAAILDTKSMVGTYVFNSKLINEEAAIKIGEALLEKSDISKILVRQFKDDNTWAIDIELKHEGTKESFRKAVSGVQEIIEKKFGKDALSKKYVASSVTWIKK